MIVSDSDNPEFPLEFSTTTCGPLRRKMSKTTWTPPNSELVVMVTCNYRQVSPDSKVAPIFDPDTSLEPNPDRWQEIFDRRYRDCAGRWSELFAAQMSPIKERVTPWLPENASFEGFLASLNLNCVRISEDESVILGFERSPMLDHHDFAVVLDANDLIQDVLIEG